MDLSMDEKISVGLKTITSSFSKDSKETDVPEPAEELHGIFENAGFAVPDKKVLRRMFHEDHIN
jgi:hypothetical protein